MDNKTLFIMISAIGGFAGVLVVAAVNVWAKKADIVSRFAGKSIDELNEKATKLIELTKGPAFQNINELNEKAHKVITFMDGPTFKRIEDFVNVYNHSKLELSLNAVKDLNNSLKEQKKWLEKMTGVAMKSVFNEVTGKIHVQIENNDLFLKRLDENKNSKILLKESFHKFPLIKKIINNEESIFIESGSSLAYMILPLIDELHSIRDITENSTPLKICTNNVIIYMVLLFEKDITPILLPGKPTNQYGATFGDSNNSEKCNPEKVKEFLIEHNVTAIFSTASYLDFTYGPHVSSKPNYDMKRVLNTYASDKGIYNVFVISGEKITNDVEDGRVKNNCKFIFSDQYSKDVLQNKDILGGISKDFKSYLSSNKTYILTASENYKKGKSVAMRLKKVNNFLDMQVSQTSKNGFLGLIYNKTSDGD